MMRYGLDQEASWFDNLNGTTPLLSFLCQFDFCQVIINLYVQFIVIIKSVTLACQTGVP
jgi:hypothetical protein